MFDFPVQLRKPQPLLGTLGEYRGQAPDITRLLERCLALILAKKFANRCASMGVGWWRFWLAASRSTECRTRSGRRRLSYVPGLRIVSYSAISRLSARVSPAQVLHAKAVW